MTIRVAVRVHPLRTRWDVRSGLLALSQIDRMLHNAEAQVYQGEPARLLGLRQRYPLLSQQTLLVLRLGRSWST